VAVEFVPPEAIARGVVVKLSDCADRFVAVSVVPFQVKPEEPLKLPPLLN
jgi:hypothetical protein